MFFDQSAQDRRGQLRLVGQQKDRAARPGGRYYRTYTSLDRTCLPARPLVVLNRYYIQVSHGVFDLFRVGAGHNHHRCKPGLQRGLCHGAYEWIPFPIQQLFGLAVATGFAGRQDDPSHRLLDREDPCLLKAGNERRIIECQKRLRQSLCKRLQFVSVCLIEQYDFSGSDRNILKPALRMS